MEEKIKLTYDVLIGLLQGKEIHLVRGENHIILAPPFDGVFLTHEQIQEIQYSSEQRVFEIIHRVLETSQETHRL